MPSSILFATREEAEHYLREAMEDSEGDNGNDKGGDEGHDKGDGGSQGGSKGEGGVGWKKGGHGR